MKIFRDSACGMILVRPGTDVNLDGFNRFLGRSEAPAAPTVNGKAAPFREAAFPFTEAPA